MSFVHAQLSIDLFNAQLFRRPHCRLPPYKAGSLLIEPMISYSRELEKPRSEAEFEDMCVMVYGDVFRDPLAKLNGRRGQKQGGVDAYIQSANGRIGVQSKRYKDGGLKLKHVEEEIAKAEACPTRIVALIVATTAANDATLGNQVMALSDERAAAGKFIVQIEFWDDIRLRIARSPALQRLYDPRAPGALFHDLASGQDAATQILASLSQHVLSLKSSVLDTALPGALGSSPINDVFTRQIDSIKDLLEATRYKEANDRLEMLGESFPLLDAHQKARWHVQRGVCRVHLFDGKGAAEDFIAASTIYPQDEKIAAAGIRGLALKHNYDEAIVVGTKAVAEWPASVDVWTAFAFAKVESGQQVGIDDVPPQMVSERRVLSFLCWAALDSKHNALAAKYGQDLLALPEPTLTEKTAAFTAALVWATENPIERDHGFINPGPKGALEGALRALEPRSENIWRNQSRASLPADASNLAYAYYLLDRYEDVLATCAEAAGYIPLPDRMISLKLVALKALDRIDELLELVPKYIAQIEPTAVAPIAEVASWCGRDDLIEKLAERARDDEDGYDRATISAFVGLAKINSGRREEALHAVEPLHCAEGKALGATIVAARVLLAAGEKDKANARLDEVLSFLSAKTSAEIRLMAADCLFFLKRYREAAKFTRRIVHRGTIRYYTPDSFAHT
jgi:tetratricopeptide (TPR) repeat protein